MDVGAINCLSYEDFVSVFGNVVERCPIIPAAVWSQRPFPSVAALQAAIFDFIDALPESGKEGILRCHPDLAGKELRGGTLTRESREEQGAAGLDRMDAAEVSRMASLNAQYKERFGFPFVICARASDKAAIAEQMCERLRNAHAQERSRAVEEVKKICRLRLQGLVLTNQINKL
ncbi:2-oxo-4-hydroxy-4-carboxy-5-ureidoimidazoline decarboxylase [Merluccius polli]|uniref:2-oxo-4-hydroxy-4-carboxy-5-ureidoimidazoline decarboxylase n=1 Tax=Merluccius polli TaxID=89951 RepID=A0AA47MMB9_MERPO|nr:2-oxo-4-hydroxy-4-carboxy-5-ureidoimidazoline decarboxylase [Merluccius polli]